MSIERDRAHAQSGGKRSEGDVDRAGASGGEGAGAGAAAGEREVEPGDALRDDLGRAEGAGRRDDEVDGEILTAWSRRVLP